jgi:hypothetical protein
MNVLKGWENNVVMFKSLQIPTQTKHTTHKMLELPDEWFMEISAKDEPVIGRDVGFLYLTPAGWRANNHIFKARMSKEDYKELSDNAKKLFDKVRLQKQRLITMYKARIKALQAIKLR